MSDRCTCAGVIQHPIYVPYPMPSSTPPKPLLNAPSNPLSHRERRQLARHTAAGFRTVGIRERVTAAAAMWEPADYLSGRRVAREALMARIE